jgi:RHS repeat-associated protein
VPWHFALQADNADGPDYTFANIMAVVNPPGTNTPDLVSTSSGTVYAPPQQEVLVYDDDGNLVSDGRFNYTWNGENRLICAEEQVCPTNRTLRKVEYAYDHQGRMVWKVVSRRGAEAQSWEDEKATSYLWDSFNIIAETTFADSATNVTYNVWGLDLDGTLQGAGGVGGLLAVVSPLPLGEGQGEGGTVYLPCYDANGNVMEYVSSDGAIAAHREYDPFGGTVVATGDADSFTHWFSTKPLCKVTGLSEYQYRKYSPVLGRWLSRDPVEEQGGLNLCLFANNDTICSVDYLGRQLVIGPEENVDKNTMCCNTLMDTWQGDGFPSHASCVKECMENMHSDGIAVSGYAAGAASLSTFALKRPRLALALGAYSLYTASLVESIKVGCAWACELDICIKYDVHPEPYDVTTGMWWWKKCESRWRCPAPNDIRDGKHIFNYE